MFSFDAILLNTQAISWFSHIPEATSATMDQAGKVLASQYNHGTGEAIHLIFVYNQNLFHIFLLSSQRSHNFAV